MTAYTRFEDIPRLHYGCLMIDPPWQFKNWSKAGERKNPTAHYDCMDLSDIAELRVDHLAAPDCMMFLWATNPMLPQAIDLMARWGFTFKTAGHWVKKTKNNHLAFGTGYCLRSAGEPFLIGTIGSPKFVSRSVRSVIEAKVREHSRKPEEAYHAAELLAGDVPKLDLFSRQERPGWDAFGNELDKFEKLEGAV